MFFNSLLMRDRASTFEDVFTETQYLLLEIVMTMLPFFLPTYGEATTLSGLLAITTSAVIEWRMILSKCVQSCPNVSNACQSETSTEHVPTLGFSQTYK